LIDFCVDDDVCTATWIDVARSLGLVVLILTGTDPSTSTWKRQATQGPIADDAVGLILRKSTTTRVSHMVHHLITKYLIGMTRQSAFSQWHDAEKTQQYWQPLNLKNHTWRVVSRPRIVHQNTLRHHRRTPHALQFHTT
jgi:hypothetical protein